MPNRCCVPGCRGNYDDGNRVSVFIFPKESSLREKWIKAIHREDFNPAPRSVVCERHFADSLIIREDTLTRPDGTVITATRKPTLTKNAVPHIFPCQPKYLTTSLPPVRTTPEERQSRLEARDEAAFKKWQERDSIQSFEIFLKLYQSRLEKKWLSVVCLDFVTVFQIDCANRPNVSVSVKIMQDLSVQVWCGQKCIPIRKLKWVVGVENKVDKWSKFDTLLSYLSGFDESEISNDDQLNICLSTLKSVEESGSFNEKKCKVIWFICEQLQLVLQNRRRYSCEFLLWACKTYYSGPGFYAHLHDSDELILPNPKYLNQLDLCSFGPLNQMKCGISHQNILKEMCSLLKDEEKLVNVLLDEIHIKRCVVVNSFRKILI